MTTKRLGVIMNGVTGRMGLNQHLIRSIIAIRDSGGVRLSNGDRMMPDPILVGRDAEKVEALAKRFNVARWTTDLDGARYHVQPSSRTAAKLGPFLVPATLSQPDGTVPAAGDDLHRRVDPR